MIDVYAAAILRGHKVSIALEALLAYQLHVLFLIGSSKSS